MHNPIGIFHSDIGNACSFQNLNIHTNEWNTTISVCASLRLIFSRRCSNVACLLVKIWYVCVCDCKSCSALKKVKTGRIYTYVYVLLTLVLSNNRPFSHCLCACVYRSRGALFLDNRRDFTEMGQTDLKPLILSM